MLPWDPNQSTACCQLPSAPLTTSPLLPLSRTPTRLGPAHRLHVQTLNHMSCDIITGGMTHGQLFGERVENIMWYYRWLWGLSKMREAEVTPLFTSSFKMSLIHTLPLSPPESCLSKDLNPNSSLLRSLTAPQLVTALLLSYPLLKLTFTPWSPNTN